MKTPVELLGDVYDKYKDKFQDGFHNALWQIMINKVHADKGARMFLAIGDVDTETIHLGLIVKTKKGFLQTTADFSEDLSLDEASKLVIELNKDVFFLLPDEQEHLSSCCATPF